MNELFQNVLNASFHGSIVIAAVLLLRLALKRAPKGYTCLLWVLVGLRLLCPFGIESSFSLQPDVAQFSQVQSRITHTQAVSADAAMPEDMIVPAGREDTVSDQNNEESGQWHTVIDWMAIASCIWLTAACLIGLYSVLSYLRLKRQVLEAVHLFGNVWECSGIDTAFILGFVKPRIYIPMGMPGDSLRYILDHERIHLERGDHWVKLVGFTALAVHWFNPLVWAAYVLLCRDIEMACDEQVVRNMGLEERKRYSAALLACSTNRAHLAACPVAFGEVSVKHRILSVLNYRKKSFWFSLIAMLAIIFVAVCFLTDPALTTEQKALRKIESELRRIHELDYYSMLEERKFEGDQVLNDESETEYWKLGDDWLHIGRIPVSGIIDGKEAAESVYGHMGVDGVCFVTYDSSLVVWKQVDRTQGAIFDPWLYTLDLDAEGADFISAQGTEKEYSIRIQFSKPYDRYQTEIEEYHVAEFFFINGMLEHVEQDIRFDHGGWMNQTTYVLGNPEERISAAINEQYRKTEAGQNTNPEWGVTMTVAEAGSTGLLVDIDMPEEARERTLFDMGQWDVQVLSDGSWTDAPMLPQEDERIWEENVRIKYPDDGTIRMELEWERVYGKLAPGQYRLRKNFHLIKDGCGYNAEFYALFEIPAGELADAG